MELPDCPSCSAAKTLEIIWVEMGTEYCECSCCSHHCWVRDGIAHRFTPPRQRPVEFDVQGVIIDGP